MLWNMIRQISYISRIMYIRILIATLILLLPVCASAQIGHWKVAPEYDSITTISPELYRVEKSGLYGLLGKDGKTIVPCQYEIKQDVVENRCLLLSSNYRLKAIYDSNGNPIKQFDDREIWYVDLFRWGYRRFRQHGEMDLHGQNRSIKQQKAGIQERVALLLRICGCEIQRRILHAYQQTWCRQQAGQ